MSEDHIGNVNEMVGQGRKDDGGKLRFDLIPPDALAELVRVYTVGAAKYGRSVQLNIGDMTEWVAQYVRALLPRHAVRVELFTRKDFAEDAMKSNLGNQTLNTQKDKKKTEGNGQRKTQIKSENFQRQGKQTQDVASETRGQSDLGTCENSVLILSRWTFFGRFKAGNAPFANVIFPRSIPSILTMTTELDGLGDCFAVAVTEDWGCLEIALKELHERLNISKPIPRFKFCKGRLEIFESGDRNWEQGISYCRIFAALMRHCWAYFRGEENDPDDGLHHMAHAAWNCMTLLAYSMRGMESFDDRPTTPQMPTWTDVAAAADDIKKVWEAGSDAVPVPQRVDVEAGLDDLRKLVFGEEIHGEKRG